MGITERKIWKRPGSSEDYVSMFIASVFGVWIGIALHNHSTDWVKMLQHVYTGQYKPSVENIRVLHLSGYLHWLIELPLCRNSPPLATEQLQGFSLVNPIGSLGCCDEKVNSRLSISIVQAKEEACYSGQVFLFLRFEWKIFEWILSLHGNMEERT